MRTADHSGYWRAFSPRSVMEVAALLGWRKAHRGRGYYLQAL